MKSSEDGAEISREPLESPVPAEAPEPAAPAEAPKSYSTSIYTLPGRSLPAEFTSSVLALEKSLDMPIFLLVQNGEGKHQVLDDELVDALLLARAELPDKKPLAVLIDSPGGFAESAYRVSRLISSRCGSFVAVVPRRAKSAATLLALGANTILLGRDAELGPLDAQFHDPEREVWVSALDEVNALDRLHGFALEAFDRTMFLLMPRTRKKVETLLPMVLHFVADLTCPLFEKIDSVHYTQMSRTLKVAEEYAIRLLQEKYPTAKAKEMARHLVANYPEHGFVIDSREAASFGLETSAPSAEQQAAFDSMRPYVARLTAIGLLREVTEDEA